MRTTTLCPDDRLRIGRRRLLFTHLVGPRDQQSYADGSFRSSPHWGTCGPTRDRTYRSYLEQPERFATGKQHVRLGRGRRRQLDLDHHAALDGLVMRVNILNFSVDRRGHLADPGAHHQAPGTAVQLGPELHVPEVRVRDEREDDVVVCRTQVR